jgi:nitroreductase
MDFDEVIRKRKSVKSYKGKRASWKDILEAVDSAQQGPFASNHNNLKFLIIEDKKTVSEVADICDQIWVAEAGILVAICSDETHLESLFGERGRIYSRQQAGASIYAFLLKLTDLGLDSCWVGAFDDELIRDRLKIPAHINIEAIVPVGYSTEKVAKKGKKNLEYALYWEEWGANRRPKLFEEGQGDYKT